MMTYAAGAQHWPWRWWGRWSSCPRWSPTQLLPQICSLRRDRTCTRWCWREWKSSESGGQSLTPAREPRTRLPPAPPVDGGRREWLQRGNSGVRITGNSRLHLAFPFVLFSWETVQLIDRLSGISKMKGAACGGRSWSTAVTSRPEASGVASLHTEPLTGTTWGGKSLVSFRVMVTAPVVDRPSASTQERTRQLVKVA